jgi:hypothetical protein
MKWKLANIQDIIIITILILIYITSNNIYLGVRNVGHIKPRTQLCADAHLAHEIVAKKATCSAQGISDSLWLDGVEKCFAHSTC